MTKSAAGKIGNTKSRAAQQQAFMRRIAVYDKAGHCCKQCGKPIPYANRTNAFCNRSCGAIYCNLGRRRQGKPGVCLTCGKATVSTTRKFCCRSCFQRQRRQASVQKLLAGTLTTDTSRRVAMFRLGTPKCAVCGGITWQGKPIPLVMDHIDGNADNNDVTNLRLVCGNCNMQLSTFAGRNRGNGRYARRQRYAAGKSS